MASAIEQALKVARRPRRSWRAPGLASGLCLSADGQIGGTVPLVGGAAMAGAGGHMASPVVRPEAAAANDGDGGPRLIAITIDDGPLSYCDSLLNSFASRDAEATFFLVGSHVRADPDAVGRLADAGMEVGMHGWDHVYYTNYGYDYVHYDFDAAATAIEDATGEWPATFRPPYGYYNPSVADAAGSLGMATIMWTANPYDYQHTDADALRSDTVDMASRNAVILMHDGYPATATAMPGIIDDLQEQGYTLVTVSKLLGFTPHAGVVYFDDNPVYH